MLAWGCGNMVKVIITHCKRQLAQHNAANYLWCGKCFYLYFKLIAVLNLKSNELRKTSTRRIGVKYIEFTLT